MDSHFSYDVRWRDIERPLYMNLGGGGGGICGIMVARWPIAKFISLTQVVPGPVKPYSAGS